jgi:hypothetical protein
MTITYTIDCTEDDFSEIAGSFASGDDAADAKQVASIQDKFRNGDIWAWCTVTVTAECHGFKGESSSLGACSYEDEAAFKACDYYKDLCQEALESLQEELALATQAEREVYLELNPIAAIAPEFKLTIHRDTNGCLFLSFTSNLPSHDEQDIMLQHDVDIEGLLKSLSASDRAEVDDGYAIYIGIQSL